MPLTSDVNRWEYDGDGVTPDFAYENLIFAASDLEVHFDEVLQVGGFAVSGVGVETGGNVTPTPVVAAGVKIVIVAAIPFIQPQDFVDNEAVDAQAFEDGLNRMTRLTHRINDTIGRQVTLPTAEPAGANMTVPALATRLGRYWGWDAIDGSLIAFGAPADTTAVSVFWAGVLTAVDAAASRLLLDVAGQGYAVSESSPQAMTVEVAAGAFFNSITRARVTNAAQTTGTITAPSVNPRIDIVHIDRLTGVVGVTTGAEAADPSAPALDADKVPLDEIALATTTTEITDSLITDVRELNLLGSPYYVDEDDMASDSASHVPSQQSVKAYADEVAGASAPRGHIDGLILSNNSGDPAKDINITAGAARDDGNVVTIKLDTLIHKKLDEAWAVGTIAGALDGTESSGGTPDADTWYHIWLIRRSDTGVVDVLASESATDPTMPTNYDQKRRIGAVRTDGTPDIIAFSQTGDSFYWATRISDFSAVSIVTKTNQVVSVPPNTTALLSVAHISGASAQTIIFDKDEANQAPGINNADVVRPGTANMSRRVDGSSQVSHRSSAATGSLEIITRGWIDPRGRDA